MANGCKIPHPLKREGTFRFERFPVELEDAYVKIDERTILDLVRQTKGYAGLVRYYNELNIEESSWTAFFDELTEEKLSKMASRGPDQNVSPHLALLLAFLKIFGIAQENLNQVTKRHLDYYYKVILQLSQQPAIPDKVAVLFEPEKPAKQVKVEKGRVLLGGKDPSGKDLHYETVSELIVNQARPAEMKTIFLNRKNDGSMISLHASPNAFTDNIIRDNPAGTGSMYTFGNPVNPYASLGFAVASPILNLKEGKRRITLQITGASAIDRAGLIAEYTSEMGWTETALAGQVPSAGSDVKNDYLVIRVNPGQPAFTPYKSAVHGGNFSTRHPVLRFTIKNTGTSGPLFNNTCKALNGITASGIRVIVQVSGVKNIVLQGDSGPVDTTKPFHPFGAIPAKSKSTFYIGSPDIFNRYLQSFNLGINWKGLPGNIRKYYATWEDGLNKLFPGDPVSQKKYFDTAQFETFEPGHPPGKLSVLDNGQWKELSLNTPAGYASTLYTDPYRILDGKQGISKTHDFWQNVFSPKGLPGGNLVSEYSYEPVKGYTASARQGFARIELQYDFGHRAFPALFTLVATENATNKSGLRLPGFPYTPEFESLSIDYTATTTLGMSAEDESRFFHLLPFGCHEISDPRQPMIPGFEDEGQWLAGLSQVNQPEVVSVYFKLEENTGNVDKSPDDSNRLNWYYLAGNQWTRFTDSEIVENTTNRFTRSGYIKFNIPAAAVSAHTILTDGLVWIKGAVAAGSDVYPNLVGIHTQAIEAVFTDQGNDLSFLGKALPAGTITKLKERITGIKKVTQPYDSYGGRLAEDSREFCTRVSERLRHKNRSWCIWDYERIVLQNFPSILKAKCISHSNPGFEYAPGEVLVVVLPYISNVAFTNLLQPRVSLSLLQEVAGFVKTGTSPFVKLQVANPVYECLEVRCQVTLKKAYGDITFYSNQLVTDLKGYLAPWSIDASTAPTFGGKIYKSQIIDFIEERDYTDYITAFDVYKHLTDGTIFKCDEEIAGSNEHVILTSFSSHSITAI